MNYIIILATLFSSIFGSSKNEESIHIQLSNKISGPFRKRVEKKFGLYNSGGGGGYIDNVNKLIFFFKTDRAITIDQCRLEYVEMLTEILYLYNHNEAIRPYLSNYPFTAKNIEIFTIYNQTPCLDINDRVYNANVFNGVLCFNITQTDTFKPEDYHKETFEEAYFKVHGKAWEP